MCGRKDHQVEALEKAEKLYRLQGQNALAVRASRARAMVLAEKGDTAGAEKLLRSVVAEAREAGEDELFSESAQGLAQVLHSGGNLAECERWLDEAVRAADRVENLDLAAMGSLSIGIVLAHSGRMAAAQPHFQRALARIPADSPLHQVAKTHVEAHTRGVPCPCDPAAQAARGPARPEAGAAAGGESLFSPAYADMLKQMLPEDLANKLQSVMSKLQQPDAANMDPETARMIRDMEARTMQRLQGMMGMFKKPG
jgi:tetratricopeptide (TPR) repeat protein